MVPAGTPRSPRSFGSLFREDTAMTAKDPRKAHTPDDDPEPGTPGTGEDTCPVCHGSGKKDGEECPRCDGTGRIVEGIGGG
jgi:hypothetical protein